MVTDLGFSAAEDAVLRAAEKGYTVGEGRDGKKKEVG